MFDIVFSTLAGLLSFFYGMVNNYAIAIGLLTLSVMLLLFPLNAKGMRSMAAMQKLSPELKKLQAKHKNDKAKLNEETMALFKEHGANPVGGCLPLILQMPVLFIMYNVIRGLTHRGPGGFFDPKYLDQGSKLYRDLSESKQMMSFGVDLAKSASEVLKVSFVTAVPFLVLIVGVVASGYYQQRMISRRSPQGAADDNPMAKQMQQMTKIMPLMYLVFGFTLPAGLNVYFLISSIFRIGQQSLIYKMDPSLLPASSSRGGDTREVESRVVDNPKPGKERPDRKAIDPKGASNGKTSSNGRGSPNGKKGTNKGGRKAEPAAPPARIANRSTNKKKKRR